MHDPHLYQPYASPTCHTSPRAVFTAANGVEVYGTAFWAANKLPAYTQGIFRAVGLNEPSVGYGTTVEHNDAGGLFWGLQLRQPIPIFNMPWADFDVPGMDYAWWDTLADNIAGIVVPDGARVAVAFACDGGHGRTGTALSIIAQLLGEVPTGEDPVKWVRARYCENAVETIEQLAYVESVSGVPVTAGEPWSVVQERLMLEAKWAAVSAAKAHNHPPQKARKKPKGQTTAGV